MGTGFTSERIAAALDAFRAFVRGERRAPILSVYAPVSYRQEPDEDVMVEKACAAIRADGASGEPFVLPTFWADFGTISTAALWGGEMIPARDGGFVHIQPVARRAADLERLEVRVAWEDSHYGKAVRLYRRVCERLGTDEVWVRTPDFQGPMNTLALLLDQTELICSLYEEPELVASALDRITDTLIEYVGRFRSAVGADRVVGNIWPYTVAPDGQGVAITQDYMPLLNPELYERFEIPRVKRIADAFGGVHIHCCGEFGQHLDVLRRAPFKIWGIEMHYPCTKVWDVWSVLGDSIYYVPYVAPTGTAEFATLTDFVRELARRDCARGRFWFCVCSDWMDTAALRAAIDGRFGG